MAKINIFFITGQSGSGKDTLTFGLKQHLESKGKKVLTIINGELIRAYEKTDSYLASLVKASDDRGELTPNFITTMLVARQLEEFLVKEEDVYIIWNGTPRSTIEQHTLPQLVNFLNACATIIVLNASDETCMTRIKARNALRGAPERKDSNNDASLKNKLEWYHSQTEAVIADLEENPLFVVLSLDAEGTAEEVFAEAITKLGLQLLYVKMYLKSSLPVTIFLLHYMVFDLEYCKRCLIA